MRLAWTRYARFTDARRAFWDRCCVYILTDRQRTPTRIGKAAGGLNSRYRGGTGYAIDAAMHESGNYVFVAAVPRDLADAVEATLIWRYRDRLPYNVQGKKRPPKRLLRLSHHGEPPRFGSQK